jgi:glycosyltransferase involved in cell wall biosynthesis
MTRLLVVLEAGDRWPSGVVRGLAYRELFAAHGFAACFQARQPLAMMDWLSSPHSIFFRILIRPFVKELLLKWAERTGEQRILRLAQNVDVVYLSKVYSYPLIQRLCRETSARVVYDFGDAVWLVGKTQNEFNEVLRSVDAVTTDNELTADYVRTFNANCTVIPDTPQVEEFDKRRAELGNKPDDRVILGWIGTPSTTYNLYVIWEALEEVFRRHPELDLRLVGTGHDLQCLPPFEKVRFSYRPVYNQAEMIEEIFKMHIGLFPLQNVEKSQVRGVLKALVYMSGEATVISSPIGQSADIIQDGVNGLLAGSTQEWVDKLELLINDRDLRDRLARNGLETVRSQFRLDQSFAKLKDVLLNSNRD